MAGPMCIRCGKRPKMKGKHRCGWCWLAEQPIEVQVQAAGRRLAAKLAKPGFEQRARVPKASWPEGTRWCAGCQSFVPIEYARGSRCRACASQAAHASHVASTYDITEADYQRLLAWQGGRCYICQQVPRSGRLAVDHDHRTGAVRGLLCSNDQWGCNKTLARVLNDAEAARRALEYAVRPPWARLQAGELSAVVRPLSIHSHISGSPVGRV